MLTRIFLFIFTNILVIATVSLTTSLLGLHGYLSKSGIDYQQLAMFCAVWGMTGSIISLLLSKFMAKMALGVRIIELKSTVAEEQMLLNIVKNYARKLQLPTIPEVGVYVSPELNAFATGPTKASALVAVSSGLLQSMNQAELEGVIGHEMSHIANGDMVTMTLLQGIVNSFAMFFSRICAYGLALAIANRENNNDNDSPSPLLYGVLTFAFDILFTILGSMVVAAFSRWREYRADAGGAKVAGRDKMIAALQRLQHMSDATDNRAPALATLKINQPASSWLEWFASHPPLAKRIAVLAKQREYC
jgi:heat shock protein HtpX